MRMLIKFLVAGAASSMVIGCTAQNLTAAPAVDSKATYGLGSGDGLRIIVYGEEKLTGEYHVTDSGQVVMPLIGPINAAGLSVEQLGASIASAYSAGGYLTAPRVAVEVLAYRPFFILGEVMKPGQYPFIPGMTVSQAIATANGYSYRAKKSEVGITRWGEKNEVAYRLDPGARVAPGDTIRVPERHF